jgi:predicted nucleic acid-binding protein
LLGTIYKNRDIRIVEPAIFLYEFINAVDRAEKKNPQVNDKRIKHAAKICNLFLERENVVIWPQDEERWKRWLKRKQNTNSHKTQDELFLYTACCAGSILVTLDSEMIKKPICSTGECSVVSPFECLESIQKKYPSQ